MWFDRCWRRSTTTRRRKSRFDRVRLLGQLDLERKTLCPGGGAVEALPELTRVHGTLADWYSIAWSSLTADNVDTIIAEQVAHYRALRAQVEWTVYGHDRPVDLRQRLAAHGFAIGAKEAVLVLDLTVVPAWVMKAPVFEVKRVQRVEDLALFQAVAVQIFGREQVIVPELRAHLEQGSREHIGYVAFESGRPAGVGRLYTHPSARFAGLYGGGTLKSFRGRGLYRACVAARARDALDSGARYLRVDALPSSQPILERLGFERLTDTWPCVLGGSD